MSERRIRGGVLSQAYNWKQTPIIRLYFLNLVDEI